jgi:hypothetical protein
LKVFTLFGTSACHLCDLAEAMLAQALNTLEGSEVQKMDISESDALFERYGILIPVLAHPDGRELCWPFREQELMQFLTS